MVARPRPKRLPLLGNYKDEGGNAGSTVNPASSATTKPSHAVQLLSWANRHVLDADVENMSATGVEAVSGMTAVRLNNLHVQWPDWAHTVGHIASIMTNTKWYKTKGAVRGRCYTVRSLHLPVIAPRA